MTSPYSPPAQGPGLASRDGSTRARPALPGLEPSRRDQPPRIAATRRRSRSRIAAGAVLVVACVFGFLAAASAVTGRHAEVLVLARPVPAGAALSAADLTVTDLPQASGVATIPASEEAQLTGRTVAVPLTAGTLLTPADLGPPAFPPSGRAIVALPLSPGAYPPDLQPGARVAILAGHSASQDSSGSTGQPAAGNANVDHRHGHRYHPGRHAGPGADSGEPAGGYRRRARGGAADLPGAGRARPGGHGCAMTLIAVASFSGSPGVTTAALGIAACWPAGADPLLAEADPSGGDLQAWFGLPDTPGMVSLAAAARRGQQPGPAGRPRRPPARRPAGAARPGRRQPGPRRREPAGRRRVRAGHRRRGSGPGDRR